MSRKKANITPELIGELFLRPGEDIPYRLLSCDSEPRALLAKVTEINVPNVPGLPISHYLDFVLLKPVRPIEKPKAPRADKGKTHKKIDHSQDITMSEEVK